jgi:hypothetical protein
LAGYIGTTCIEVVQKIVFTLEQNKFIIMSYYRNGVKIDGEWTYSIQACKEEFLANYLPNYKNVLAKFLTYIELLIVLLVAVVLKKGNRQVVPR